MKPIAAILLAVLSFLPASVTGEDRAIAVVKTRGELESQPLIDLGKGVKIRLGIEALTCPVGSGVMLYCLCEGYDPDRRWNQVDRFGPVRAVVETPGLKQAVEVLQALREEQKGGIEGRLLFLKEITMPGEMSRKVRIVTKDDRTIAVVEVKAAGGPCHPWFTLKGSARPAQVEERQKGDPEDLAVSYLTNRVRGWAMPTTDPMQAIRYDGDGPGKAGERAGRGPLPTLVPAEPTPGFSLKIAPPSREHPVALRIASKVKFNQSRPDWHFLARWWVNGKPFRGEQHLRNFGDDNGHMRIGKNLELRLRFDAKSIGARSRDRVAVQLLYSPNGWGFLEEDFMEHLMHANGHEEKIMLTNPVEWVED